MTGRTRVLIVEARYYEDIAQELASGAIAVLNEAHVDYDRVSVPGSFEIPAAIERARLAGAGYDGYIALGCVIRGETDHYDHICREVSRALMDLTVDAGIALGFGVLTCATREQALARAAVNGMNRGAAAARACLRMLKVFARLSEKAK